MPLTRNYLQFNFTLATGNFDGGGNTYQTTPGLRASATILKAGSGVSSTASFAVYGLDQSTMNKLTTFGDTLHPHGKEHRRHSGRHEPVEPEHRLLRHHKPGLHGRELDAQRVLSGRGVHRFL